MIQTILAPQVSSTVNIPRVKKLFKWLAITIGAGGIGERIVLVQGASMR
jgi:hypothetical protein